MTVMVETVTAEAVTETGGPSGAAVIWYCISTATQITNHSPSSRVYVVHWSEEDGPGPTAVYAVSMME